VPPGPGGWWLCCGQAQHENVLDPQRPVALGVRAGGVLFPGRVEIRDLDDLGGALGGPRTGPGSPGRGCASSQASPAHSRPQPSGLSRRQRSRPRTSRRHPLLLATDTMRPSSRKRRVTASLVPDHWCEPPHNSEVSDSYSARPTATHWQSRNLPSWNGSLVPRPWLAITPDKRRCVPDLLICGAGERIRTADLPLTRRNRAVVDCRWPSPDKPVTCTDRRCRSPCVGDRLPALAPHLAPCSRRSGRHWVTYIWLCR
jgi:hypothetical protein